MCTVTYIPAPGGFILTSSRDERVFRPTLPPSEHSWKGMKIIYPKDELAGGSWIAVSHQNRIACLLNGAFENHIRKEKYSKSRGQVLLDNFEFICPVTFMENVRLEGVEPFTLLLIDYQNQTEFYELRWDGEQKYRKFLNPERAQIWSSATLYDKETQQLREQWFTNWLIKNRDDQDYNILNFHTTKHSNSVENDIRMKREQGLQTLSVSQIRVEENVCNFRYFDFIKNLQTDLEWTTKKFEEPATSNTSPTSF